MGFHDGTRCHRALSDGTGAVDLETKPSHGPDGCDFVTSPVAPPRRSSPAPTRGHERACRRPDDGPPESAYGPGMGIVSPGFSGRGRSTPDLPPGQYLSEDFPVLSAARRPRRGRRLAVHHHHRDRRGPRVGLVRLPCPRHGVTDGRPALCDAVVKAGHVGEGVSLDTLLAEVETGADYASVDSYGGYITNLRWRTCSSARGVGCLPVR